ncbi:hypothetical protein G9A89_022344 [Geosiphon pyriformis]|nr:hypothetical protein G9A89_022344 [Geosiphon pyriformis]
MTESDLNAVNKPQNVVIGLRIGQSYSSIAIINKDGRADCIANEDGERQIPTVVAFSRDEEFTGTQAKAQLLRNSKNTITQFRNLIGKSYEDANDLVSISTASLANKDDQIAYIVEYQEETTFTAAEIMTKYISRLGESAINFLGQPLTGVVLAIPTYFNQAQCDALKKATEDAGLKVLQLIHEPVAAALAYQLGQPRNMLDSTKTARSKNQDLTTLIIDLGSESLDVTILSVRSGIFTIFGTTHDSTVGGVAFDELLVTHFANEFKRKTKIDISDNKRALAKLRTAAEVTKKTLSNSLTAPCSVESLSDGLDFHGTINRTRFEMMASKLFDRCLDVVWETLQKNSLEPQLIDEVILVGGASRIPKLQTKLREIFQNPLTHFRLELEPDEIVAYGCAFQAALIATLEKGNQIDEAIDSEITNVPHLTKPIGVVNTLEQFITLIPENTPLPVRRVAHLSNGQEQQEVYLAVWEGLAETPTIIERNPELKGEDIDERLPPSHPPRPKIVADKLLAELVLTELPIAKPGVLEIELVLEIDANKKFTIIVTEKKSNKFVEVEIPPAEN